MIAFSGLRARILWLTVPPLVTLTVASLWMVNRNVSEQAHRHLHDELRRSAAVFENMINARSAALGTEGAVIVRDPKFFSVLALPASAADPEYRATVSGVAQDFNRITHADLFEVMDARGRCLTSVGSARTTEAGRKALLREAMTGHVAGGLISQPAAHYQAVVTPVIADRRIVGALLLGAAVGPPLATQLRELTHGEVTFLADGRATGTTLDRPGDRLAAAQAAADFAKAEPRGGPTSVTERAGESGTWMTLAGRIPGSAGDTRHLYVLQRSLDIEMAFLQPMRAGLMLLGLIAVLLVIAAGVAIGQGITLPIARLVRASEAMERGQYDYPVEVTSHDEVGTLARRFEVMRSRQRAVVESLQETARVRREFIGVASHELRTPISVIQGFHELFRDGVLGAVTDAQARALDAIGRSVATLAGVAADATRMAQIEDRSLQLALVETDLSEVLDAAVRDALGSARNRQVVVDRLIVPANLIVEVDAPRLTDAVANLVRNGIRFTPDGGRVTVRTWRTDEVACIEVRDNGVGMAPERLQRLLDRQVPVRDSLNHHSSNSLEFNSAGLGLGLSIARGLIEAHGGILRAESTEGDGSAFTIELPLPAALLQRAA